MAEQYPEMVLAASSRADGEPEAETREPNQETAAEIGEAKLPPLDPRDIAERVYQLMCAELRVECQRRGWNE